MKWFNNLKMVQKLVSAFVLVALFIGIVGIIGMVNINKIDENLKNIYNIDLVGVNDIAELKANLLKIKGEIFLISAPINKGDVQNKKDSIADLKIKDEALITQYKTTITTDLDRKQSRTQASSPLNKSIMKVF